MTEARWRARTEQARRKVEILEQLLEDKTRALYLVNEELRSANEDLVQMYEVMAGALLVVDAEGTILRANRAARAIVGDVEGAPIADVVDTREHRAEVPWGDERVPVLTRVTPWRDGGQVITGLDLRERKKLELDLRHAQKLEAVGQLAAGVAHEINTPMQYVGDNVQFLQETFEDVLAYVAVLEDALEELPERVREARERADLDYVRERGPRAFARTLEGVARVAEIVAGLRAFSHPSRERTLTDVNEAVRTTAAVARHEYKYVADLELALEEVPEIRCSRGDLHQVLLNLVVNAAHAIEARGPERGRIRIATSADHVEVRVSVSDTGSGIDDAIRDRIFEPFFTTKDVGKGTGQGLPLARALVVEQHRGRLWFDTSPEGTTFHVALPREAA